MPQHVRVRAFDAILDDVFRQYRDFFLPLMVITLVFLAPMTLIGAALSNMVSPALVQSLLTPPHPGAFPNVFTALRQHPQSMGTMTAYFSIEFALMLLSMNVVGPLSNGAYYLLARDSLIERRMDGSVWAYIRKSVGRWGAYLSTLWYLVGLTAAACVAIAIVVAAIVLIGGLSSRLHAGSGLTVLLALVGLLLYIAIVVVSVWVSIRLMFVFVSVVLEHQRNWRAIRRSWFLTKGSFWRIFGIILLVQLVLGFANLGLYALITHFAPSGPIQVLSIGLISIILAPLIHLLVTNLYVDLRIRREGYDLELQAGSGDA